MKYTCILFVIAVLLSSILSSCESTTTSSMPSVPIGDVGNDLQLINGKLYTVLDNSDKILVGTPSSSTDDRIFILDQGAFGKNNARIDSWDWTNNSLATSLFTTGSTDHSSIVFPTGTEPWKILQISSTEALAAEYMGGKMAVVNLTSNTITSTIDLGTGQNSIASLGNNVYVTTGSNTIISIDKSAKALLAQNWVGENPGQVLADSAHNSLLIFTAGNYAPKTFGKILWVKPSSLLITDSLIVDTTHYINEMVYAGSKVYILYNDKVQVLDMATHKLSDDALFTKSYYGGYFDAAKNLLYLGTAVDFQSNDVVDVFDLTSNTLKRTINVGIAPSFFAVVR
jgi:hypothetical protein